MAHGLRRAEAWLAFGLVLTTFGVIGGAAYWSGRSDRPVSGGVVPNAGGTATTPAPGAGPHGLDAPATSPAPTASPSERPQRPPAPIGLVARAGDGEVALSWTPVHAARYRVSYRDATANEDWVRLPLDRAEPTAIANILTNNHQYQFRVSAVNGVGEGPPSAVAGARPVAPHPNPPTRLTAAPGPGHVYLSWRGSTPRVYYWVYVRDVTTGAAWERTRYPTTNTWIDMQYLTNGHSYEFRVTAINTTAESAPSNVVRAVPG